MEEFDIPLIVCGRIKKGEEIKLYYDHGEPVKLNLPRLESKDINYMRKSPTLSDVPLVDIVSFLDQVGSALRDKNYDLRREMIEISKKVTGFSEEKLHRDIEIIGNFLMERFLWKFIDVELCGRSNALEGWIKVGDVEIRATPRGKLLHILSGNIPEIAPLSVVRGILTKNANIAKVASRDPISPLYFVLSMIDTDKTHPVNRSLSIVYWTRGDKIIEENLYDIVDGVLVWGGEQAVTHARGMSRVYQSILEFGPKRSICIIDKESVLNEKNIQIITKNIARDVVLHDQQACLSPLVIFIEENVAEKFCRYLAEAMSSEGQKLPRKSLSPDEFFRISYARNICSILGDKIIYSHKPPWMIILTDDYYHTLYHPLLRVIFVVKVRSIKDAIPFIDGHVMVVAFPSYRKLKEYKNDIAKRGVERLTVVGKMNIPPIGFSSSHTYPMFHMVRFICRDLSDEEKRMRVEKLYLRGIRM